MICYEAIKSLTPELLEEFLDQVFLTGLNTGYQSLVDPDNHDGNPFSLDRLNTNVEGSPALVEDETGEKLIIEPPANIVKLIVDFDMDTIPENISWQMQVILPKGMDEDEKTRLRARSGYNLSSRKV